METIIILQLYKKVIIQMATTQSNTRPSLIK